MLTRYCTTSLRNTSDPAPAPGAGGVGHDLVGTDAPGEGARGSPAPVRRTPAAARHRSSTRPWGENSNLVKAGISGVCTRRRGWGAFARDAHEGVVQPRELGARGADGEEAVDSVLKVDFSTWML